MIDGNALFKVGFHGASQVFNSNGRHIGGLYQFITVLRMLMVESLYHKVFVFWDGPFGGKLRYEIYEDYKGNRNKDYINGTIPDDPNEYIERQMVQEYLHHLFVRQLEHPIVESDDFIAYYCITKLPHETITICTNDSDITQLIGEDIRLYHLHKTIKNYITPENFNQFFKHDVRNTALIKSISGDNADFIKGVRGVKDDTLLKHFPELSERKVTLGEILVKAEALQEGRIINKKKPLVALDHLLRGVSSNKLGEEILLGNELYKRNWELVNLQNPMLTDDAIEKLHKLIDTPLEKETRKIKDIHAKIKRDGIDELVGDVRRIDYLLPFKKLMERELKTL